MDFLSQTPIVLKLICGEKTKEINCHKNILESKSGYFKNLFSQSIGEDYTIHTDNIDTDIKILEFLYTDSLGNENIPLDRKISILHRLRFFGISPPKDFVESFSKRITKEDCEYLLANYNEEINSLEIVKEALIKYIRLFLVDFENPIKILIRVYTLSRSYDAFLFKSLISQMASKSMMASSKKAINDFYAMFPFHIHEYGEREININEMSIYSYIHNIKNYIIFKCDHYIIYLILSKFGCESLCSELDLNTLDNKKIFQICESSDDIILIKKAVNVLKARLQISNPIPPEKPVEKPEKSEKPKENLISSFEELLKKFMTYSGTSGSK